MIVRSVIEFGVDKKRSKIAIKSCVCVSASKLVRLRRDSSIDFCSKEDEDNVV